MLTDVQCKKAVSKDKLYRLLDQQGLYFVVSAAGAKYWQFKYTLNKQQGTVSLGRYPAVSLLAARMAHADLRDKLAQGINPGLSSKLDKLAARLDMELTFNALADEWFEQKKTEVVERSGVIIDGLLKNHVRPVIGDLPIKEVKPMHVLLVLKEMEAAGKMSAAIRARQLMSNIFKYGVITLRCETDPASPLEGYIKRPPIVHARALARDELGILLHKISGYQGRFVTRELVLFQMLCFVRSAEAIGAQWSEIDWDKAVWRIPAERMKMGRPHLVPLTRQTLSILNSVQRVTGKWDYIFPGTDKRKPMGTSTINNAIRNAIFGYKNVKYGEITSHDFRATASTWLHEEGFLHDAIELQLAHAHQSKVVATYNQAEHLDRRREMMQWYHDQIERLCPELLVPRF